MRLLFRLLVVAAIAFPASALARQAQNSPSRVLKGRTHPRGLDRVPRHRDQGATASKRYEIGLSHEVATLGPYRPTGTDDGSDIEAVFGEPASIGRPTDYRCVRRWPRLGLRATFNQYGSEGDACDTGVFVEAVATRRRWVTTNGVRPGSRAAKARRRSVKRCRRSSCGVNGYALELHQTDCASQKVAGVIAVTRGTRVRKLVVRWRGCE